VKCTPRGVKEWERNMASKQKFNTAYDHATHPGIDTGEETMTVQYELENCDINNIMAKYEKTGIIEHCRDHQGQYGDFSEIIDYQATLQLVQDAHDMFLTLPAKVRKKFDNDPGKFLQYADDPANLAEMREMGLVPPETPEKTQSEPPQEVVEEQDS
jgi:phage internal scaffolding protein